MPQRLTIQLSPQGSIQAYIPGDRSLGHWVDIPLDLNGLEVLKYILTRRDSAKRKIVGTDASPTQAMIDDWLKTNQVTRIKKEVKPTKTDIEKKIDKMTGEEKAALVRLLTEGVE